MKWGLCKWELEEETGWLEYKIWVTTMKGTLLKKGYIALQAEGHAVHFRKVGLLDLSDTYNWRIAPYSFSEF